MHGRCLCGAVGLQAAAQRHFHACHCGSCRRWGGGPLLAVHCGTDVVLEGEAGITRYASSPWAERGFCSRCGTHLFFRLKDGGDYYVPLGLFDDAQDLAFASQVFIDRKPAAYSFAEDTEKLTEREFLARYAPD